MDISVYYTILDIGIQYQKTKCMTGLWMPWRRYQLMRETEFWQRIMLFIENERNNIDSAVDFFTELNFMAKQKPYRHYERVAQLETELLAYQCTYIADTTSTELIDIFLKHIFSDIIYYVKTGRNKSASRLLCAAHNLPKALYGANPLHKDKRYISYKDAIAYSIGYLNAEDKKRYSHFLLDLKQEVNQ